MVNQHTANDYFFNSCVGKAKKGLEITEISVVDVEKHQAYTLSVQQTRPNNSDSGEEVPVREEKQTKKATFFKEKVTKSTKKKALRSGNNENRPVSYSPQKYSRISGFPY